MGKFKPGIIASALELESECDFLPIWIESGKKFKIFPTIKYTIGERFTSPKFSRKNFSDYSKEEITEMLKPFEDKVLRVGIED